MGKSHVEASMGNEKHVRMVWVRGPNDLCHKSGSG
jgi:hypothetical protein